ncbi:MULTISPECIES: TonB-dependent receptor [unclassified Pseudomonas]|uniref:TonB-dependent receptor n=1 Tax=unclassified Pseudomonas TaxID=196821 RepID=UPI001F1FD2AD|nr:MULTISPECIES: TonB-dependent siderophore receptor [unclassified Pseudomonas]MCF5228739.1 TonB-dependent siderophore receptor [Pseudomonas sp. PA-5-4H]MCF5237386.1 TonB-dependent siderophore receptor [Pseudomonas sp. PA-5-4G]MCF5246108.1 TonB-dependent siderophore receptor [Pseudomonas sp. PA-5-4B]MCF5256829.1 TonB-dependent siderophore receptor [Pseudomonas sp. PA-5-4B]MCF5258089.1 TonB-dependent siderophore receptor [Pseudomonas sp. PA-5-4A]
MSLPTPQRHTLHTTLAPMFGFLAAGSVAPTAWADAPAATPNDSVVSLPQIKVDGQEATSTFKVDRVTSAKISQPLLDAPQSVTIVPQQVLKEQNAQTLQEVLRNVPGITFMSGEGNLGWGDLFSIRGFSSEQSLTVDGVRDAGMSTRTDTFNLQQAEVFKGTGSIESGVSAVGGSVNLVSKEAHLGDANKVSAGIGTDSYRRLTADLNKQLTDTAAVRINLMKHYNQVADRDDVDYDRWGIATSFGFGLGTDTRFFVDTFYQKDTNTPDGGVPIQRGTDGHRMPGVKRSDWYGDSSLYTQENETTSLTARFEHDFDWHDAYLRNQTRWERSDNFAVLSPARFFVADASGKKTCTGARCATLGYTGVGPISQVPGSTVNAYTDYVNNSNTGHGILRGGDFGLSKRYTILDNQTDFSFTFNTGSLQHAVVSGLEFYHETYGGLKRNAEVPAGDLLFNMNDPSHSFASTYVTKGEGDPRSVIDNAGVYAGDTVTLNEQWQVLGSLRYDNWRAQTSQRGQADISSTDGAVSGRVGAVYKPLPNGSIYVSYSEAAQPSALGASTNNQIYGASTTSNYSPAKSKTYEIGTKWDIAHDRLNVTAAIFRTELDNAWEYQDGESAPVRALPAKRVDGIELGLQGNITPRWTVYTGFSALKSTQTKGINKGAEAKNVPDLTANLWTTYAVTDALSLSYGEQYVGRRRYSDNKDVGGLNNNSSYANGPSGVYAIYTRDHEKAPGYWLSNLAAQYKVNKDTTVNLNLNNVFNTFYYSQVGASLDGFQLYGIPGAGRTLTASVDYEF